MAEPSKESKDRTPYGRGYRAGYSDKRLGGDPTPCPYETVSEYVEEWWNGYRAGLIRANDDAKAGLIETAGETAALARARGNGPKGADWVVALSGGQDSTTCLHWARKRLGPNGLAVGFDYGQRHRVELKAAARIAADARIPFEVHDLPVIRSSALTGEGDVSASGYLGLPASFTPGRNLVMGTVLAQVAYVAGAHHLVMGVCETDFSGYPDCRRNVIDALQDLLARGMEWPVVIHTPLMWLDKAETVRLAMTLPGCYEALRLPVLRAAGAGVRRGGGGRPGPCPGRGGVSAERRVALVEHFPSIQGEGWNAGRRAYFVRFAGCNLDCVFDDGSVCDTPWRKANLKLTVGEIVEACSGHGLVILTGGEPTIHPAFDEVVVALREQGNEVAVETNGTTWRDTLYVADHVALSPKGHVDHARPTAKPLIDNRVYLHAHELRLVVTAETEPDEHRHFNLSDFDRGAYLSPATLADGSGDVHFRGFAPGAVERALEMIEVEGAWRLSLQTHKFLGVR